ncbi:GTP-binding protein [Plectosphaerella plurivora]|uniref:GTP-binding protein n=1 Tax=Plectosphaerella plurivora TaxID=936078 RepID=A0A9P9ADS2_9PEZI|nr:GTP-binding protein [Plectosphaerella plurivora]
MVSGSIFTYDGDPQRVSSPWLEDDDAARRLSTPHLQAVPDDKPGMLADYNITKLRAEPQEGATEYKLHLLLRVRRRYKSMSTVPDYSGAQRLKPEPRGLSNANQSRQLRLEELTNQLLWRLQQSCPLHSLKSKDLVIPKLPDDTVDLSAAIRPQRVLPGLEDAAGALYEIGVADDGTLVGLTKDEMDESITTLKVMAATLGCTVRITQRVVVGESEWIEYAELIDTPDTDPVQIPRHDRLLCVEALVVPDLGGQHANHPPTGDAGNQDNGHKAARVDDTPSRVTSTSEQLRVSMTGPTTSGKSTLLGTLLTGTLDNGRGQSRLSLFKHRHEVISGMTSSVAQELIGYKDESIINYARQHVEHWLDIHYEAEGGRLVFVSDSAGHPRFRRTILRGLFGWAPQWTVLCVAADDREANANKNGLSSSAQDVLGSAGANVDLVKAHLELCLKLKTPLVVVITKVDLATKASMQRSAGKAMTLIKEFGRVPKLMQPAHSGLQDATHVAPEDRKKARDVVAAIKAGDDLLSLVPIVFTSAVTGTGVGLLHALLESLPLPPTPTSHDFLGNVLNPEQPSCLFHIDDTFSRVADFAPVADSPSQADTGIVVSGYLRFGQLSVGDSLLVGPFPAEDDELKGLTPEERPSPGGYGLSISHPSSAELARIAIRNAVAASTTKGEWHNAKIVSIRNLRLSVRTLEAGQVGTIGILFDVPASTANNADTRLPEPRRIRKGMVLAVPSKHMVATGMSLQAASSLTVLFEDERVSTLQAGSLVNVYVGSVRAAARVKGMSSGPRSRDTDEIFAMNDNEAGALQGTVTETEVVLELLSNREWVELGAQIVVLEGGRNDRSGLEGFVGRVVEIVD